jgi:nickel-dependent lactate racemase
MSNTLSIPWGNDQLEFAAPVHWRILGELKPAAHGRALEDLASEALKALKAPISAQRLSERDLRDKRVVLVVDDHSRPTPVREFIGPVLDELAGGGMPDGNLDILIATGAHRDSTEDEVYYKIGAQTARRFGWQCHKAHDPSELADLGRTSRGTEVKLNKLLVAADLIICLGAVEPHLLLGFGGGLKMLVPGCASARTIGKNHMQGVEPEMFDYVGTRGSDSPMRLDLEEAAGKLGKEVFIVNVAMNEKARPTSFFAGDAIEAQRAGEQFVESHMRMEIPERADLVITNSHPMDADMRQSVKCLGNTLYACKEGGVMMGLAKSEKGLGEMPLAKKTLPYTAMRTLLKMIGKKRVLGLVERVKAGEPIEEVFIGHFGLQMMRRNHLGIFCDNPEIPEDIGRRMGLARSFKRIEDLIAWANSKAPAKPTVWVFPYGGVTYTRPIH